MNKELRKLSRKEILEILLEQTKRIEELEIELEKVRLELSERKSNLKNVGSLAEASLVLADIFKAADETVNIYIKNVKELARKEIKELKIKKLEETKKEIKKLQKENNSEVKDITKKRNKKSTKKVEKIEVKEEKVNE